MRILLVEDEPLLAMSLMEDLIDAGHVLLGPAVSIARAVEIAQETRPDLAILSINLQHGNSGLDLAKILLTRFKCPSLFVSGDVKTAREGKHLAIGFISKPYQSSVIVQSIEVARQIMAGEKPQSVPNGLELFEAVTQ